MTGHSFTKILLGFSGLIVLGGIVMISLYNYQLIQAMQTPDVPQTAVPEKTQIVSGQIAENTARPVVIDPENDLLAPVKQLKPTSPAPRNLAEKNPSKTYETPLKSPVLVQ
ncbi:MAG TPA: hypothetical protein PLB05_08480 [Candidatus Omnitrophota bacterium]|nr:hypothetical protein [Candidatus Omnitrophota bacterium]